MSFNTNYNLQVASDEQYFASHEMLNEILTTNRHISFNGQFQSGKTICFTIVYMVLLTLEINIIDNVIIFSGVSNNRLKEQYMNKKKLKEGINKTLHFLSKYPQYKCDVSKLTEIFITERVNVLFSQSLTKKKYIGHIIVEKTAFIHDESYIAQSVENIPFQFLEKLGINPNGKDNKCIFISVSSTSFSELLANTIYEQNKAIIKLKPTQNYYSIGKLYNIGKINFYKEDKIELSKRIINDCLNNDEFVFILIRNTDNYSKMLQTTLEDTFEDTIDIINYDSTNIKSADINKTLNLHLKPDKIKVILIKGFLRMGENIYCKLYIKSFIENFSSKLKFDTCSQSIGRFCGEYLDTLHIPDIYVPATLDKDDFERYDNMYNNTVITDIPHNAMNIIPTSKKSGDNYDYKTSIPILCKPYINSASRSELREKLEKNRHNLLFDIAINPNTDEDKYEIFNILNDNVKFSIHNYNCKTKNEKETIDNCITNAERFKAKLKTGGNGIDEKIAVYWTENDNVYLIFKLTASYQNKSTTDLPFINAKCIYADNVMDNSKIQKQTLQKQTLQKQKMQKKNEKIQKTISIVNKLQKKNETIEKQKQEIKELKQLLNNTTSSNLIPRENNTNNNNINGDLYGDLLIFE